MLRKTMFSIKKPQLDNRSYRYIKLSNNLSALLINDPDADKSAAALDVNVGSFADPKSLPGLAHFCEHLLFLGTKKYPLENEYNTYLSENSGYSNAFTSSMHTNYYFEVKNDALHGALDRFSQFFISPLFSPSGKDREVNAVDSENKKNLQADNWRLYQMARNSSNVDHPYNGFSTGNKYTLGDLPESQGLDVRDELIKFHAENYSANLMSLCILSNEPLDKLESWTNEMFSEIVDKSLDKPYYIPSPFNSKDYLGKIYKIKPNKSMRSLEITFPIPSTKQYWEYLPTRYLAHLIGHESKGSLLFTLKNKGWANDLSAGAGNISPGFSEFTIDIDLTLEGLKNYQQIIQDVFKYISMLIKEGPKEWIFQELNATSNNSFTFKQKMAASTTVSKMAGTMQELTYYEIPLKNPLLANPPKSEINSNSISPENLLALNIIQKFDPELIENLLSYFKPDNFKVFLVAQELFETDIKDTLEEKWYGTEYTIDDYPVETLKNLSLDPDFTLPEKNLFIPTDFSLTSSDSTIYPKLVEIDQFSKIWYKANPELGGPRSSVIIKFNLPGSTSTPLNSLYLSLFAELFDDELNSTRYLASLGGLSYNLELAREGLSLKISGYSHKLEVLLTTLLKSLNDFTNVEKQNEFWGQNRKERYEILKEKLIRGLKNFGYSTPYQQVGPIISSLANENSWLVDDEISCLPALDYASLVNYSHNLLKICFVEVFVIGNYSKDDAKKVHDLMKRNLPNLSSSITLTQSQFTRGRSLQLPTNEIVHYVKPNDDKNNINSCIEMFIQLGLISESRNRVLNELVAQIIHEPCFNRLRTIEQLGYVVFSGTRETRTTFGLRLLVQSEYSSWYLLHRIESFLQKMVTEIENLSLEALEKHIASLVNKKEQKFKNLSEEKNRHWNRIASGYYDFDRYSKDVEILKSITREEISEFFKNRIVDNKGHGQLTVHLQSQKHTTIDQKKLIKNAISNFVYSRNEFDSLNYEQEKVDAKVDELELAELLNDDIFKDLKCKTELMEFIEMYIGSWDGKGKNIIGNVGEWKCGVPLTAAPTAKILQSLCDDDLKL